MKQNNIKELILSIRKSRHNMLDKIQRLAQVLHEKADLTINTQKLSSMIKDAFTKRRAKTFYADILSNTIEESTTKAAHTFKSVSVLNDTFVASTYTLGDPILYTVDEEVMDPQLLFLTDEEAQNFSISIETNADRFREELYETLLLFDIPDDELISELKGNCTKVFYAYMLAAPREEAGLTQGEYIKITITYDGVDYVYLI